MRRRETISRVQGVSSVSQRHGVGIVYVKRPKIGTFGGGGGGLPPVSGGVGGGIGWAGA